MTKSTITRERLEALANAEYCKSNPGAWLLGLKEVNELASMALAAMDSEPVAYADPQSFDNFKSNGGKNAACTKEWMWRDHSAGLIPLYRHAQPAQVVPYVLERLRSIVSDPRALPRRKEWISGQQYSYVLLDNVEAMVDEACRAAMLHAEPVTTANKLGNSPVIPDGLIAAVNRLLDTDGSRGCYSAIRCYDAHDEIERLLAAAPQEVKGEHRIRDEMDMGARITSHRFKV